MAPDHLAPRRPRPVAALAPALALAALAAASCAPDGTAAPAGAPSEPAARPSVLLVVVDTLRRDHLGCYGYGRDTSPAIDALAAGGVRFERAVAQAPWTTPSIAALLSSRYPSTIGILDDRSVLPDELDVLPEILGAAGWRTGAVISHSFCSSRWNFDQGFEHFDESNVLGHKAVTSPGVTERALAYLDEHADEPFFLWLHYFDPHCAYVEHPEHPFTGAAEYDGPVEDGMLFTQLWDMRKDLDEDDLDEMRRLYDSEIAFTDHHVGRVLGHLESLGIDDRTIVVFTADHGEEFQDHGRIGHAKTLYDELIGVPLILRAPGVAPGVVEQPVSLVDVVPTLLELLDLPPLEGAVGAPLPLPGRDGDRGERFAFSETQRRKPIRAVVGRGHKLIEYERDGSVELFPLEPGAPDARDVAGTGLAVEGELRAALDAWRAELERTALKAATIELTDEERAHLEALGYVGDDD